MFWLHLLLAQLFTFKSCVLSNNICKFKIQRNPRSSHFIFISIDDDNCSQNRPGSEDSQFYQPEAQFSLHGQEPAGANSLLMNCIPLPKKLDPPHITRLRQLKIKRFIQKNTFSMFSIITPLTSET